MKTTHSTDRALHSTLKAHSAERNVCLKCASNVPQMQMNLDWNLAFYRQSAMLYHKTEVSSRLIPMLHQKSATFHKKSPIYCQKSPTFDQPKENVYVGCERKEGWSWYRPMFYGKKSYILPKELYILPNENVYLRCKWKQVESCTLGRHSSPWQSTKSALISHSR